MAKSIGEAGHDAKLDWIAESDELHLCIAQPGTYTEASSTYSLGSVTLTAGDGNGDYTIAADGTGGRKLTVAAQSLTPSAGTATHVALVKTGDSTLRAVTTCPVVAVTATATDVGSFDIVDKGVT